jgi:hypothetical protein
LGWRMGLLSLNLASVETGNNARRACIRVMWREP